MVKAEASEYLNAEDIQGLKVKQAVIKTEPKYVEKDFGRGIKKNMEMGVELSNKESKIYTMNKTTERRFIEAEGDETKQWIGSTIKFKTNEQMVGKKMRWVIMGFPIVTKEETVK